jgi:small subunit ribosomal protein S8
MSVSDPIADMLTKIRNAVAAKTKTVIIPTSKLKFEIAKILKAEGYIESFKATIDGGHEMLAITLKYDENERPVIHGLERKSKSGRRQYTGYKLMPRVYNGFGTLIVSTSKGVVTGKKAAANQVGGEIICSVW